MISKLLFLFSLALSLIFAQRGCDPSWVAFRNNCYFVNKAHLNWTDAESFCVSQEAHLASVHDFGENKLISDLVRNLEPRSFINWLGGFSNDKNDKIYAWSDDSKWDFSLWAPSHPYQYPCVAFIINPPFMSWVTSNCEMTVSSICKKPVA